MTFPEPTACCPYADCDTCNPTPKEQPMTDHQPLDLDTIETQVARSGTYVPVDLARALIAEVKRLRGQLDLAFLMGAPNATFTTYPATQPDPLDENDHRDRVVGDNVRLVRHGPRHWHPAPYTPCCRCPLSDPSLSFWARSSIGPLTFADTPQHTQEAHNRTQTASDRAALADIAQAAHNLSQAICDWLDLKENQ